MTREEAIEVIKQDIPCEHDTDLIEALDMAIKSLEQEPCDKYIKEIDHLRKYISKLETQIVEQEPCEDAISRQAVINGIDNYIEKVQSTGAKDDFISFEELVVKALPPVAPKQEIGHWSRKTKVDAYDLAGVKTWGIKCQCDRCTFTTTVVEDFGYYTYCPNCGAKIESEDME